MKQLNAKIVALQTRLLIVFGIVTLCGCNFSPKYSRPTIPASAGFKEATTNSDAGGAWKPAEPRDRTSRGKWWEIYGDDELNGLEYQASLANQTVAAAVANFLTARALVKEARAGYFPTVGLVPAASRSKPPANASSPVFGHPVTSYSLPLDASWEPDLWGSVRNTVRANNAAAQASAGDLENTLLTVQAEVAADYYQIRALDSQKEVLDSTVVAYRESYNLTKARYATGIASDEDVAQAETQLKTTQAQATDLGIQRAQMEHAIAVLTGRPPSALAIPLAPLKVEPVAPPAGLPAELLERRPDIAAAERRVAAANAQIGVARAAYYPTLSLTGSVGFGSSSLNNLITWPNLVWSVGSSLSETLFDAGRRRGVTQQAWAAYEAAVATYRQTVLSAFQEVEDSLSTLRILGKELNEQDAAVMAAERYLRLANERYRLGIDSYLNVITAQTSLLSNQRTAISLRLERATASVQLVKALGGGWSYQQLPSSREVLRKQTGNSPAAR